MELQQSPLYLEYIQKLKWKVERINGLAVIYRKIFLIGSFAKIQRTDTLPDIESLHDFILNKRISSLVIEPSMNISQKKLDAFYLEVKKFVRVIHSPYLPTKTRILNIIPSVETIFNSFTEAKRRAVRRAEKYGVIIHASNDIQKMIWIKSKSAGLFGSITAYGLRELWGSFQDGHAAILLATYQDLNHVVGGVFLIFWEGVAYYWLVGATREGKRVFAPTLLVYEAIKLAKKSGCTKFDFVGVWDERYPKQNTEWQGFTKFKEGFGGTTLYYPITGLHNNAL